MGKSTQIFLGFIGAILVVNVLYLDFTLSRNTDSNLAGRVAVLEEKLTDFLLTDRNGEVRELVAAGEEKDSGDVEEVEVVTQTSTPVAATVSNELTKEVIIPLGSGSTSSIEWVKTGAQSYIDTTVYPSLDKAYFQASLRSNSGAIFARLRQKNENTIVGGSNISHPKPESGFIISSPLGLSSGNKLYEVEIRSETGQSIFVENASVKLILK